MESKENDGLWFQSLDQDDIERIQDWCDRFEKYVLLELNGHTRPFFLHELDFCMALDFNKTSPTGNRTELGEAVHQLKYHSDQSKLAVLLSALFNAFDDLPIPSSEIIAISCIPSSPGQENTARSLAEGVADALELEFVRSDLLCDKTAMKDLSIEEKIPQWQEIYNEEDRIDLQRDVSGQTIVIIDDLYQSGATIWCYAEYLKDLGANYVFGLPCVKSMRDTDNQ